MKIKKILWQSLLLVTWPVKMFFRAMEAIPSKYFLVMGMYLFMCQAGRGSSFMCILLLWSIAIMFFHAVREDDEK